MTKSRSTDVIVDGRVSDAKLDELLALQVELPELDFKRSIDLTTRGLVELAKDIGAMSVLGGYLIGGVDDSGTPVDDMDRCRPQDFDEANLAPRLAKYLPQPITIRSRTATRDGHTTVLIHVVPHPAGYAIFHTDGQYHDDKGKPQIVFRRGEAFWRDGTRSVRISQEGMEQIIQRRITAAKRVWIDEQQTIRARERDELRAAEVARAPLGSLTLDLPTRELQVAALELLRVHDRIALQHLMIDAQTRARSAIEAEDLGGLGTVLGKLAGLGAILLQYGQIGPFDQVVDALAGIYSIPLETAGDKAYGLSVRVNPNEFAPKVFLAIIERVYGLGSLAVRLGNWEAVRTLCLQVPERVDPYYPYWLRHALTTASRANQFDIQSDGGQVAGSTSLLTLAASIVEREPAMRPDSADDESVLTSLVQFDLLANLAAIDGAGSAESRVFYTNWARFRQSRVQAIANRVITDPPVRQAVFRNGDDAALAIAFQEVARMAQSEGFRYDGFVGWNGTLVGDFVGEHGSDVNAG